MQYSILFLCVNIKHNTNYIISIYGNLISIRVDLLIRNPIWANLVIIFNLSAEVSVFVNEKTFHETRLLMESPILLTSQQCPNKAHFPAPGVASFVKIGMYRYAVKKRKRKNQKLNHDHGSCTS